MIAKWNKERNGFDLELSATDLGVMIFGMTVAKYQTKDPDVAIIQQHFLDLYKLSLVENAQVAQPKVIANPFATHDMCWPASGNDKCVRSVQLPNDKYDSCDEPVDSPIHGRPYLKDRLNKVVHWVQEKSKTTYCGLSILVTGTATEPMALPWTTMLELVTCKACLADQ